MQPPLAQEALLLAKRAVQAAEVVLDLAALFVQKLRAGRQQQSGLQGRQHHHADQQGVDAQ
ncbi:hypothetical protein VM57_03145 [Stenotrophomonas maltophilia]|uniref:Uncharacterized protein n=1 Tax=Stenotrophomonas maltophilia TaxID=40324 RepID=A0A0F5ZPI3_STEMA|nr:hypothetical protein VM57_03145 [Stenotrophomonas maltophilia]